MPCRLTYSRKDRWYPRQKDIQNMKATISSDKKGKILHEIWGDFNTGAYASWGPTVANKVPIHASGPYKFQITMR